MSQTVKTEDMNKLTTIEPRTTTRKIGTTTFIITSSFNNSGKGDIVSKIARLIQNDSETSPGA